MAERWSSLDGWIPDPRRPGYLYDPDRPGWLRDRQGRWFSARDIDGLAAEVENAVPPDRVEQLEVVERLRDRLRGIGRRA